MSKTLKVIYSTLAVVMIVNSFAVVLPVVGYAQAIEKQAIQQAELSQAQKAELEKAQKEAKLAMYKELNLSTKEKQFVETHADKMEVYNQTLDKYVTYNKSNGNATLNVTSIYKDIKAISKATGLTQSQVLTLKDIALKQVRNYNKTVNAIKTETIKNSKVANNKSLANQELSETKISKTISDRAISVSMSTEVSIQDVQKSSRASYGFDVPWMQCRADINGSLSWWGGWTLVFNNCATILVQVAYTGGMTKLLSSALSVMFPGLGTAIGVAVWVGGMVYASRIQSLNYNCGFTGIKMIGTLYTGALAWPISKC